MLVRESLEFKKGQSTKSALGVGLPAQARENPHVLKPFIYDYLRDEWDMFIPENPLENRWYNPDFALNHWPRIVNNQSVEGEYYTTLKFVLPISNPGEKEYFRYRFSRFVKDLANFAVTDWVPAAYELPKKYVTRKNYTNKYTNFDITIQPREYLNDY